MYFINVEKGGIFLKCTLQSPIVKYYNTIYNYNIIWEGGSFKWMKNK